jgi:hypothetical protein
VGDAGHLGSDLTGDEIATPARIAVATVSAVPANAGTLPQCPSGNAGTDCIDNSCNLMSRDSRVLNARPGSLLRERVAMADAASFHPDTHFSVARFGYFTLNHFNGPVRASDLRSTHLCHIASDRFVSSRSLRYRYDPRLKQLRLAAGNGSCRTVGLLVRGAERDLTGFVETPNLFLR